MTLINKNSEYWKSITVSVISENLSPIHRMVSEKFSSENSKFLQRTYGSLSFCHTAISQFLMADISFNIACQELKIAQIAQLNQLFQVLHLVHIYSHGFYELSRMLMRKNVNNDVSKDSPMDQRWRQNVVKTKKWHTSRSGISTPSIDLSRPSRDRHAFLNLNLDVDIRIFAHEGCCDTIVILFLLWTSNCTG